MKAFFSNLLKAIQASGEARARAELHTRFTQLSDRQLADIGISRRLLNEGIQAWPWRTQKGEAGDISAAVQLADEAKAIDELQAYSDRELADIGISRSGIIEAVTVGSHARQAA